MEQALTKKMRVVLRLGDEDDLGQKWTLLRSEVGMLGHEGAQKTRPGKKGYTAKSPSGIRGSFCGDQCATCRRHVAGAGYDGEEKVNVDFMAHLRRSAGALIPLEVSDEESYPFKERV